MEYDKYYLTLAKYKAYLAEIKLLEIGEGSNLLARLLASSPGSGMGRPNDLPAHIIAGEMRGYLQEIKTVVRKAEIIDEFREMELNPNEVALGRTVSVQYEGENEVVEYTLLGQKEVDLSKGRISCFSPIGEALMGKSNGETIVAKMPGSGGDIRMKILNIENRSLDFKYEINAWKEKLEQTLFIGSDTNL